MAVWIPQWDLRCEKCSESQKKYYGCEEDSYEPNKWQIREWSWQRCPIKLITETTNCFLIAYNYLQKGILPYEQGYKRNSNRYVKAMQIIDREVKRLEIQNAKQIRNK